MQRKKLGGMFNRPNVKQREKRFGSVMRRDDQKCDVFRGWSKLIRIVLVSSA